MPTLTEGVWNSTPGIGLLCLNKRLLYSSEVFVAKLQPPLFDNLSGGQQGLL